MKKTIRLVIAVLLVVTVFSVTAAAEDNIDAVFVDEEAVSSITVTDETIVPAETAVENAEGIPESNSDATPESNSDATPESNSDATPESNTDATPESNTDAIPEDNPDDPADYVISSNSITLENGMYSYELISKPSGELVFDNYLENTYQGVDGKYKLHYEIEEDDNHIMIVKGLFKNILTASPLLRWFRDAFSEDTYSYELDLRTNEGFTYTNNLRYLFNGETRGYSIYYNYDLLTNKQTFDIGEPHDEEEESETWGQKKLLRKRHGIFSSLLPVSQLFSS